MIWAATAVAISALAMTLLIRPPRRPGRAEPVRARSGMEAITWLILIGAILAAVIAAVALYNTLLTDQADKVEEQEIPCVYEDDGEIETGTLQSDGSCS